MAASDFLPALGEPRRGKVRDVYDLGETLLIVACDRISAYDHVLQPAIPGKGKVLSAAQQLLVRAPLRASCRTICWRRSRPTSRRPGQAVRRRRCAGRAVLVRKNAGGAVRVRRPRLPGGQRLPRVQPDGQVLRHRPARGLRRADRLPEPIFTPATKAESGTTRTSTSRRSGAASARSWRAPARPDAGDLPPGADHAERRHAPGRHQVRVRPLTATLY